MSSGIVICLSGGMDSATLLALARDRSDIDQIVCLGFWYGQRHEKELISARAIAGHYKVPFVSIDLRAAFDLFGAGSAMTDRSMEVPEGHYEAETMKATIVPNRNMIFLSIAGAMAIQKKFEFVGYAAHAGDHAVYPDCRPPFTEAMAEALYHAADLPRRIRLWTPFLNISKKDIVNIGFHEVAKRNRVPYELTWSCYKGGAEHCGKCGTCVERIEAFKLAGIIDATVYETDQSQTDQSQTGQEIMRDLSKNGRLVWDLLAIDEPTHIDELLRKSALGFGDLNTALVELDIRDLIRVLPGKNYARRDLSGAPDKKA